MTSKKERFAYCLFFLGQNILWGYAGYVETFLTDVGIAAAAAAMILLVPKLWDAVNDMLFGYLIDRTRFKNGQKFIPWVRIGVASIGVTTVALFAIPQSASQTVKVVWFLVAYILFDISYTILDAPAYAVTTVMTSDVQERTAIIAGGKLWAMVGGVVATLLVPMLRPKLGWFAACVIFVVVSVVMMVPMLFFVKERHSETATAEENPSFEEIMHYLRHNKYLMVALVAMLLLGVASLEQKMAIYVGRICLGQENTATLVAAGAAVSVIIVSAVVPKLSKKWDKFHVLCAGLAFTIVMDIVAYFVGYDSLVMAIVMTMLKCSGLGFWSVVIYMLIADTVEYGTYKTGTRAAGILRRHGQAQCPPGGSRRSPGRGVCHGRETDQEHEPRAVSGSSPEDAPLRPEESAGGGGGEYAPLRRGHCSRRLRGHPQQPRPRHLRRDPSARL